MDANNNDKYLPSQDTLKKSNSQYQKKKKAKDISADVTVNLKYENFEPVYNRFSTSFKKGRSKINYENVDILDQSRFKFILKIKTSQKDHSKNISNYSKYSYCTNSQLNWDDIWFVIYYSVDTYTCSICLEKRLTCPVITKCGHIFCWPCLLNYYEYWTKISLNKKVPQCPLCKEKIAMGEIKFCEILQCVNYISSSDFKIDDKFEKNEKQLDGKNYNSFNTNYISFNLVMKNKKAPTLYNTFYDPDLEYFKTHLHQKDAFNFIPLENQEEFSFSRIFITNQTLTLKRYEGLKSQLENALKDELEYVTDERIVASLNMCIETLNEKISKVKFLIESGGDGEGCDEVERQNKNCEVIPINHLNSEPLGNEDNLASFGSPQNGAHSNSDTLSNQQNSENINNFSTLEDEFSKNDKNDLNLKDFVYFFQEQFGDIFFLHPINYDILLAEYTNEQHLPTEISGKILEIEMHQITPSLKNKYPFLNHLKIGSLFYFVEIDLKQSVSNHTIKNFHQILKERAKIRTNIKREEEHYDNWVQSIKSKEERKISSEYWTEQPKFIKSEIFRDDPSLTQNEELNLNDRKISINSTHSENEKKESKLKNLFKNEDNNLNLNNQACKKDDPSKKILLNDEEFPDLNRNTKIKHPNKEDENIQDSLLEDRYLEKYDESSLPLTMKSSTGIKKKNKKNKNYEELDIAVLQENKKREEIQKKKEQTTNISAGLKIEKKLMKENKIFTSSKNNNI